MGSKHRAPRAAIAPGYARAPAGSAAYHDSTGFIAACLTGDDSIADLARRPPRLPQARP